MWKLKRAVATVFGYALVLLLMPVVYLALWVQDLIDSHYLRKRKG
jgi:hypothetical protein